jgi:hypothetical protein
MHHRNNQQPIDILLLKDQAIGKSSDRHPTKLLKLDGMGFGVARDPLDGVVDGVSKLISHLQVT